LERFSSSAEAGFRYSGCHLVLGLEIELDLDIVGIAKKDLPARAVGHLVDAVGHALAAQMFFFASKPRLPNAALAPPL
jgi:hypothetical protein